MEYVLTENGNIKVKDGKPLVKDGDNEFTVDALGANDKVRAANDEAKKFKKSLREKESALEKYVGIDDPAAALDALQKVGSMDEEVSKSMENLKSTLNKAWQEKVDGISGEKETLEQLLRKETVTNQFMTSPIVDKLTLPKTVAAEYFGKFFKNNGTAVDAAGNVILSKEKPGEPAGFDEALGILIETHPDRDSMLKGSGASGSGGHAAGPGGPGAVQKTSAEKIRAGLSSH